MMQLLKSYQEENADNDDSVEILITIQSPNDEGESIFSFSASKRQAALYVLLGNRNQIKILPTESFGSISSIESLIEFLHSMMDADLRKRKIDLANRKLVESSQVTEDDFISNAVEAISSGSFSFSVSLIGEEVKGPILVGEVLACLPFYTSFQNAEVGFYQKFVIDLDSTQILHLARGFKGEIESYFTSKRSIDKLLFKNHGFEMKSALHSNYGSNVLKAIDKKICVFPQTHVSLRVSCSSAESGGDTSKVVKLQTATDKEDLKKHLIRKPNGKNYLVVESVSIDGVHTIDRNVKYLFPTQRSVSPAIDAETMIYHAGYVSVRLVANKFQVEIPITENIVLSSADEGDRSEFLV